MGNLLLFYINYEECKYPLFYFCYLFQICFILTMRNVNELMKSGKSLGDVRFILTMRNVNFISLAAQALSTIVLY